MRRLAALASLLPLLASCATIDAHEARHGLLGMSQRDVLSCIGIPEEKTRLDAHDAVLEYTYSDHDELLSLELLAIGTLSLGPRGQCNVMLRMHDGAVAAVHFSDSTTSEAGALGACGPVVHEALRQCPRSPAAAHDDPMALFDKD
jgi:hypothetical protein